jgi:hypothetical protein
LPFAKRTATQSKDPLQLDLGSGASGNFYPDPLAAQ